MAFRTIFCGMKNISGPANEKNIFKSGLLLVVLDHIHLSFFHKGRDGLFDRFGQFDFGRIPIFPFFGLYIVEARRIQVRQGIGQLLEVFATFGKVIPNDIVFQFANTFQLFCRLIHQGCGGGVV